MRKVVSPWGHPTQKLLRWVRFFPFPCGSVVCRPADQICRAESLLQDKDQCSPAVGSTRVIPTRTGRRLTNKTQHAECQRSGSFEGRRLSRKTQEAYAALGPERRLGVHEVASFSVSAPPARLALSSQYPPPGAPPVCECRDRKWVESADLGVRSGCR